MISRTFDAQRVNELLNHPDIAPWVMPDGMAAIDVSAILDNPRNYCFIGEFGGFLFVETYPALYELHSFFTQEKGGSVLHLFKQAIFQMFTSTECEEIYTYVPDDNIAAKKGVEKTGFRHIFSMPRWKKGGETLNTHHFVMTIHEWAAKEPELAKFGEWFHEQIGEENTNHGEIEAHDVFVGAALVFALSGQPEKAEWFYNKWAAMSGFAPVEMISTEPMTFSILDKKYVITDHVEVLPCQQAQQ